MKNNYGLSFEEPILELERKIEALKESAASKQVDLGESIEKLEAEKRKLQAETYAGLSAWDRVRVARHPLRPVTADYLQFAFDDHVELCGDRRFADDKAIYTGFATIGGKRVMLVAHRKGKTTNDRIHYNFGYANPEGYRKALLRMRLAEKFGLPVVCLIDTPGANPDVGGLNSELRRVRKIPELNHCSLKPGSIIVEPARRAETVENEYFIILLNKV